MRCYLVRGCPGTGKTTFCSYAFPGMFHIENDMWHMHDGKYDFDVRNQNKAISWCLDMCRNALNQGMDVVVSNTFTKIGYIEAYKRIASEYEAEFKVFRMRGEYENIHHVPENVLKNMKEKFADWYGEINVFPNGDEADSKYSVTDISVGNKIETENDYGIVTEVTPATYGFINIIYVSGQDHKTKMCYTGDCWRVTCSKKDEES